MSDIEIKINGGSLSDYIHDEVMSQMEDYDISDSIRDVLDYNYEILDRDDVNDIVSNLDLIDEADAEYIWRNNMDSEWDKIHEAINDGVAEHLEAIECCTMATLEPFIQRLSFLEERERQRRERTLSRRLLRLRWFIHNRRQRVRRRMLVIGGRLRKVFSR